MTNKKKGVGNSYRNGISLIEAVQKFGDETQAEKWFLECRWPNGMSCPRCESHKIKQRKTNRPTGRHLFITAIPASMILQ